MKWSESKIVKRLREHLEVGLPGAVIIKHTEHLRAGVPDLSVTWHGKTTWLEVKFENPTFVSNGIQRLTMKALAREGRAVYAVYNVVKDTVTMMWPDSFVVRMTSQFSEGNAMVCRFIRDTHQ